jgi:hypothetical protein
MSTETPTGCWEWNGARHRVTGYCYTSQNNQRIAVHRLAWQLANDRPVPPGMYVLHRCDNRPCCNPTHLWIGTAAENTADMDQKGRRVTKVNRGESHHNSRLTVADVLEIRRSTDTQPVLAARFGVAVSTIAALRGRASWRWLSDERDRDKAITGGFR